MSWRPNCSPDSLHMNKLPAQTACLYLSLQTFVPTLYTPWVALTPGPHHWMGHTRCKSGIVEREVSRQGLGREKSGKEVPREYDFAVGF